MRDLLPGSLASLLSSLFPLSSLPVLALETQPPYVRVPRPYKGPHVGVPADSPSEILS